MKLVVFISNVAATNYVGLIASLQNVKGSTILSGYTYTYYSNGTQKTKTDHNNITTTYAYDENNRLLNEKADYSDRTEIVDYTYDCNGNLTDKFYGISNSDTSTGTSLGMCLVNSDQDSYERYTYDTLNRLVIFEAGTTTAEYSYRADGLRYSKTINAGY